VKNMGKYQAWDGGQFAVAAPSGTMVAQNVVSGIAPDDMTVVMARGEVELAPLPIANWDQHVPVLVRLVVYKRLPSQPVLVQTGDPFDTTTQNGLNDGEQGDTWAAGTVVVEAHPVSTQTAPTARRIVLEPRTKRRLRKGDVIALQLVAESSESVQVNIAYSGFLGLFTTEP